MTIGSRSLPSRSQSAWMRSSSPWRSERPLGTSCRRPSATATSARSGVDAGVPARQAIHGMGQRAISVLRSAAALSAVSLVSASSRTAWVSRRPPRCRRSAQGSRGPRCSPLSMCARRFDDDGNRGHFVSNSPERWSALGFQSLTRSTADARYPIEYPMIASPARFEKQ